MPRVPRAPPGEAGEEPAGELDAVQVPTLVVQGETDPFGCPKAGPHHEVVVIRGTHSLDADLESLHRTVHEWLAKVLRPLTLSE